MAHLKTKLVIAGIILVGALTYLASAGIKSGFVYFLEVDRYLSDVQFKDQRVRLHGRVANDGFSASSGSQRAQFKLQGKTAALPVLYRGAIPDQFAAGRDVVIEGRRDASGVFQADLLMTKCASKYEPNSPHASKPEKRS
jgi:cytochrome c-type biogenesis protein CcmE